MKDNISTLYGALKNKGYTDIGKDETEFRNWLNQEGNVKTLYGALSQQGFDDIGDEQQFTDWVGVKKQPKSDDDAVFEANAERLRNGQPTERVTTQSMIDAHPELGLEGKSYQYKPEVQEYILKNKPDMFKPKTVDMYGAHSKDKTEMDLLQEGRLYDLKEARQNWLQRPVTSFGEAFEQGTDALYQGGKNLVGETANIVTGSQRDYQRAKTQLDELVASGYDLSNFDAGQALKDYKDRDYQRKMNEWQRNIASRKAERKDMGFFESLLHKMQDPSRPKSQYEETGLFADELQLSRSYQAIQDALQKSNGNIQEAYKLLGQKASEETWGDETTREARQALASQRPTEGFGAWVGGMVPQMIGTGAGILASMNPYTRWLARPLGMTNMAFLTGATSGMSMAEARKYAEDKGIPMNEGEMWRTGLVDAAIEYGTEKIPFNRYFGRVQDVTKKIIGKEVADATLSNDVVQDEVSNLLQRASKEFRNGLFTKENIKEYLKDVGTEGVSEFMAEALQTLSPVIYQNPEDYPTLVEVLNSGLEGAKGGLFMGVFLGGGSLYSANRMQNYANRKRREKQGSVSFVETDKGIFEILGYNDGVYSVMDSNGEQSEVTADQVRDQVSVSLEEFDDSMNEARESHIQDVVDEENAQIDAATDPQTGLYGEVTMIDHDENGEQVDVTVNVYGEKVVNGKLYLLVEKDGQKEYIRPMQYYPETYQKRPAEEVKALNEEMIREEAAAQAELESKYAPEVLSAQMQQGVPFNTPTSQIVPVSPMPEGNGWIVEEYAMDENGKPSKNVNVREFTNDEYRDMLQAQLDAEQAVVEELAQSSESVGEQVESVVNTEVNNPEASGESMSPVEVAQQPQVEAQQAPVIPTKEDGSIDFVTYGKEGSFKTLGEKYGEKMPNKVAVTAKAFAEDVAKAQTKLDKAQEAYDNAPIGREEKAEKARDKAQQELDAIKREADFWAEMDADIKSAQLRRSEILNPQAQTESSNEPMSADEFVAQQLAAGNIVLNKDDYMRETGFGSEEANAMNGGAKKLLGAEGMTIQEAGERLMEMDRENGTNFFDQSDSNAGRDALISVLGSVKSRKELNQYIANNRAEQAKRDSEGLRSEVEKAVMDANFSSLEDFVLQMEAAEVDIPFMEDRADEIMAIFAEETAKYEQSLNNTENEQGRTNEVAEGSDTILSEEQSDDTGGTEERSESERVGDGLVEEGESAHVGGQADEVELKQQEGETILQFAERVAEENRRRPLRKRANEWSKALGVKVTLLESIDDVDARTRVQIEEAHAEGSGVPGWVAPNGEVFFFMPDLHNMDDVDKTYIHEVVAHIGLPKLLGEERFNEFCDKVWEMMPQSQKDLYEKNYPGVKGIKNDTLRHRRAADEYIAHLAEDENLTPEEKTIWDNIVKLFRDMLDKALNGIIGKSKITNEDISNLIKASYANLKSGAEDNVSGEGKRFRVVYHGSAADFDKFDHSKMGSGAGSQVFGWGTYVSELEKIGRDYGDVALQSENRFTYVGDKDVNKWTVADAEQIMHTAGSYEEAIKRYGNATLAPGTALEQAVTFLKSTKKEDWQGKRHLYEVEIPDAKRGNYIIYGNNVTDAAAKKVFDGVYNRLSKTEEYDNPTAKKELKRELDDLKSGYGQGQSGIWKDLYGDISYYLGSDKEASLFLRSLGYVGIKYPAGTIYQGDYGGASNYVIFDENDLQIVNHTRFRMTNAEKEELRDSEETKALFDYAKKRFGRTFDLREAGYILPDGVMLDFSGRHEMNPGSDTSHLAGYRSVYHRYVADLNYKPEDDGGEKTGFKTDMADFINRGAIRMDGNIGSINLTMKPTSKQKTILQRLIQRMDGDVWVDFGNGWDTEHSAEYSGVRPMRVLSDIDKYYDEGIKPEGNTRFRIANQNQEIFVSNAQRVVEGIKQEKGTPQQWLAMIEKNGGLKAGEDKWLGLSDWLKGSDKKSLTKDEILDFIGENKIRIEEVNYRKDATDIDELFDEYEELYENEGSEVAHNEMISRYGEEFDSAFKDIGGELRIKNQKVVDKLLGKSINSTRLNYTTEGLENKAEIALTVPTIEPWDKSDEIHFGDAGEGRAIAWIRFGETFIEDKNLTEKSKVLGSKEWWNMTEEERKSIMDELKELKQNSRPTRILVIDEIQSNRHQEGREKGYDTDYRKAVRALEENKKKQKETIHNGDVKLLRDFGVIVDGRLDIVEPEYLSMLPNETQIKINEARSRYEKWVKLLQEEVPLRDDVVKFEQYKNNVPEAPFEKNWHELAMKRMLRYAAENGYDKVAWTTGAQQAERYNIGGVVSSINYYLRGDGAYRVETYGSNGYQIESIPTEFKDGQALADVFGKELATKMVKDLEEDRVKVEEAKKTKKELRDKMRGMNDESAEYEALLDEFSKYDAIQSKADEGHSISGDGLRVGGEGMKGFYDKMLPSFVNKYVKKWGTKVQDIELLNVEEAGRIMHSVDVTDAMKESVMEGQTMFRVVGEPAVAYATQSQAEDIVEVPREKEFFNMNNVARKLYQNSGRFMSDLYKNGTLGRVLRGEFAEIDQIKAKKEYDYAKPILDEYLNELVWMKHYATEAAQDVINDVIRDVEYSLDYYRDLALGKDVWRTKQSPRFRIVEKKKEAIQQEVDKFTAKYNSKDVVVAEVSSMTDEEIEEMFNAPADEVREAMGENLVGGYDKLSGKIFIFVDNQSLDDLENSLFHENMHGLFHGNRMVNAFDESIKDNTKKLRESLKDNGYRDDEVSEEVFVRVAANALVEADFKNIEKYLPDEYKEEFYNKIKDFGYEREQESNQRGEWKDILPGRRNSGRSDNSENGPNGEEPRSLAETDGTQGTKRTSPREQAERLGNLFGQVADMGLEGVLGNKEYTRLMVDIYKELPEDVRTSLADDALRHYGGSIAPAVSDYVNKKGKANLWDKIAGFIREALRKVGVDVNLNANDAKYILWRSRKPLNRVNLLDVAEDIDMRYRLKVGEHNTSTTNGSVLEQIKQARTEVEKNPTEAQKEAGNYKKGHITLDGYDITLENPKGGIRSGTDRNGKKWSITMNNDYGYIRGTEAVDGDHIDIFLSENPTEGHVFVVDQRNEDGSFDESKVMYGFNSLEEARQAYLSNYEKGWESRIMAITEVSKDEFKRWIDSSHRKTKPFSEYKHVKSNGGGTRFRVDVGNKLNIRDEYEATIKKGSYQAREAVQDNMLSLRKVQELIEKASGKKLRDFENAWMHENRLSSVVQSAIHEMERKYYKPMTVAVKKLMGAANLEQEQVADYLMLKHGIERNREMAVRKALTDSEGKIDRDKLNDWYEENRRIRKDASLDTWRKKQEAMDDAALMFGADMSRDYSGLTSMFDTDDLADCTERAYDEVEALENAHPAETEALDKAIKAMTQNTLDESFGSGLMNKAVYEELSNDMYDYYIPLRGFEETTSDEVYAYMDNDRGAFNAPLVRAKGRSSKSDNPIAYLKSIAESGIMQGERNKMKQTFLNMVTNHPSDLVSVREGVWAIFNPATGEWEAASFPESKVPRNATPADVQAAYEKWEEDMELRAKTDPNVKKISEAADVPYRVIGNRMNQHQVIVKRLGKSYTLTINGNPRLAMALNGLTNPNNTSNDGKVSAYVQQKVDALNRNLSAWYTTRNPDFVASNFMRDTFYTNTIVRAKEGNNYANHFHAHYAKLLMPGRMISLFSKYENGTLDLSKPMERDFHEFMMNGGETGYSNLKDLEHIKKQIAKDVKGGRLEDVKGLLDKLDLVNRAVENTARFAAYRTSRQQGRSVARSIFDAKEISVNFNKKGAGGTFFGATGQTGFGNLAAMVGAGGRAMYVFFNAAIQGTTNLLHVMKVNPAGTGAGLAAMFLMGAVLPMLLGGDDEKDYYDLPEHVRRNHLILPGVGDSWISIPLPIEYRIMYGMGELLTSWRTGHERGSNIGMKILSLTGQALPLNFLEEGVDAFMPSALSPLWQVYNNQSWTGLPIYKDNEFNKDNPEYTKAYKNVNRGLYKFTKALYRWTFDEDNQEAGINLNPAVIEHIAKGYFGGLVTTLDNVWKTGEMVLSDREFDWRNIPVGNRIFKTGDERTKDKRIQNEYFENVDKLEFMQSRERLLRKTKDGAGVPEADKLEADEDYKILIGSDVYKKYVTDPNGFKAKKKKADKLYRQRKEKGDSENIERDYYKALEEANKSVR